MEIDELEGANIIACDGWQSCRLLLALCPPPAVALEYRWACEGLQTSAWKKQIESDLEDARKKWHATWTPERKSKKWHRKTEVCKQRRSKCMGRKVQIESEMQKLQDQLDAEQSRIDALDVDLAEFQA